MGGEGDEERLGQNRKKTGVDGRYIMFKRQMYAHVKGESRLGSPAKGRGPTNLSRGRITVAAKGGGS